MSSKLCKIPRMLTKSQLLSKLLLKLQFQMNCKVCLKKSSSTTRNLANTKSFKTYLLSPPLKAIIVQRSWTTLID